MNFLVLNYCAVALGGAIGAIARYSISLILPFDEKSIPYATLIVNGLGCLLIGILYVQVIEKQPISNIQRELWLIGFLGALTTFSTFSLEVVRLLEAGNGTLAAFYIVLSIIICIVAAFAGVHITRTF